MPRALIAATARMVAGANGCRVCIRGCFTVVTAIPVVACHNTGAVVVCTFPDVIIIRHRCLTPERAGTSPDRFVVIHFSFDWSDSFCLRLRLRPLCLSGSRHLWPGSLRSKSVHDNSVHHAWPCSFYLCDGHPSFVCLCLTLFPPCVYEFKRIRNYPAADFS